MEEKYLMLNNNILNKALHKIKMMIDIKRFDDTKILIHIDDKVADKVTLKKFVISIACIIKDDDEDEFCPKMFLEEALAA